MNNQNDYIIRILKRDKYDRKLCPHCNNVLDLLEYSNRKIVILSACMNRDCTVYGEMQRFTRNEWHNTNIFNDE